MGLPEKMLTISELSVNDFREKTKNDPLISTLGVKMALNIVNMPKYTPLFPLQA